ncbi:MAG: hypothetical protein KGQ26_04870 [Rhodospirillales bacterium]|nr:hypothetical protein [Rhodospirillales bacterium]
MKRLATLFSLIVIIGAGLLLFWPRHPQNGGDAGQPAQQAENHGPRGLSGAEQAAFLPLVCGGASGPGGGFAHQCANLPGYPGQDYGGAGLGLGITLQSVIYGHLTSADAEDAYVTYAGSFESLATNLGGGIMFTGGPGHWKLKGWYPGGQAGRCVSLNPHGRAKFLCLYSGQEQGETDSLLTVQNLPPPSGEKPALLSAADLRGTVDPNGNCQNRSGNEAVLLSISGLRSADGGAEAEISYVSGEDARAACLARSFAKAPVKQAMLALRWDGSAMKLSPDLNFAPAP